MSSKTVFISYRRQTGSTFAQLIRQALTLRGYDVFLDVHGTEAGQWAEQIKTEVPRRAHFLLLLTPNALDGCADPEDWVRREFELAVKTGRNVVPVCEGTVDRDAARKACPGVMAKVFDYQIAEIRHEALDRDLDNLVQHFIAPHMAPSDAVPTDQPRRIAVSKLQHATARLVGRDDKLADLDAAWTHPEVRVVTLVAWGGVGKTSLVASWAAQLAKRDYDGADYFDWSFYSQGVREHGGRVRGRVY